MEEALYEITSLRQLTKLSINQGSIPEETPITNFRHLLEQHALAAGTLTVINGHLEERGLSLLYGTIVDATIIQLSSSTKIQEGKRDPQIHQTKMGHQAIAA